MGTRADFYLGKNKDAQWLGSIAWDGYRDGIPDAILLSQHETDFRLHVKDFIASRDDGTKPEMGWPWPWETSETTDCSYWFFDDQVWEEHQDHYCPVTDSYPETDKAYESRAKGRERIDYPDMSKLKNVTLGPRSGVIVMTTIK
jgi:hypothetical protein